MSAETQEFLREAVEKAQDALNECIGVFAQMAKTGYYPQPLMGRGWEFAIHARDALKSAAKQAGLREEEGADDVGFSFGSDDKRGL